MARKAASSREHLPPTITAQRAIELIGRQLQQFDTVIRLQSDDPEVGKWTNTTEQILRAAFGEPHGEDHEMLSKFKSAGAILMFTSDTPDSYFEGVYREGMATKKAILESCLDQLQILAPPIARVAPGQYQFHQEIERVSGGLFRDGHYKQAALEAYIRVIDEVKQRSALTLDGDSLMNRAFACDRQAPIIQFNKLSTDAERDEQRGFLFLFKGIVGLRNLKAHSNALFDDPLRAHEYLALASVLMRVLEIAKVNPLP
ncbi:MAG: TIGR02391 family protein [Candidatus Acidiferrales bacterium]